MLEVIQNKFPELAGGDDLEWPLLGGQDSSAQSSKTLRRRAPSPSPFALEESEEDEDAEKPSLMNFWTCIRDKYTTNPFSPMQLSKPRTEFLPENWSVVHIAVSDDKNTMFVSRQRAKQKPLVFCLPLKGRRESDDDEHLTFQDALDELKEIVRLNDETTRQAIHIKPQDKEARAAWWADRMALDQRLKELLENIEFCWLGAFKVSHASPNVGRRMTSRVDDLEPTRRSPSRCRCRSAQAVG
jgi:separase